MKIKLLLLVGLTVLLTPALSMAETAVSQPAFPQDTPGQDATTLTLNPAQIQLQAGVSPEAPFAFNALVPTWIAVGEAPEIQLRTSIDRQNWSEWRHIPAHNDWTLPEDNKSVGASCTLTLGIIKKAKMDPKKVDQLQVDLKSTKEGELFS